MEGIRIKNPEKLNRKIADVKKDGSKELHLISDFDRTLTNAFTDGKKISSSYALLRNGGYLGEEYTKKDIALFEQYYPLENDPNLSDEEKYGKMEEWWSKHYQLFIDFGLTKDILINSTKKSETELRQGSLELFDILKEKEIPLLIFSAGLGDLVKLFLEKRRLITNNVHIISNFLKFDDEGNVIGYSDKLIHVYSKNEVEIKDTPYYQEVAKRKNVILLGDSLGDLGMTEGMEHDTTIRIGFLNEKEEELFDKYSEAFDVVILNDGSMDYVNGMLKEILNN